MYSTVRLSMLSLCLLLSACAGKPTVIDQHRLQALPLYDGDKHARFTVYVSCEAPDELTDSICLRSNQAFARWASDREINLTTVDTTSLLFTQDQLQDWRPAKQDGREPYVVAIYFSPQVVPSFGAVMAGGSAVPVASTSRSAKIGYRANVRIFDTAHGKLVEQLSSHDFLNVKPDANGAPYIRAVVADLVANLDPFYEPDRPALPGR